VTALPGPWVIVLEVSICTVQSRSEPATAAAYADAARQPLARLDPCAGFCGYVERIFAMQAADRGFTTVLTMASPPDLIAGHAHLGWQ
jgi:hypothetical protein